LVPLQLNSGVSQVDHQADLSTFVHLVCWFQLLRKSFDKTKSPQQTPQICDAIHKGDLLILIWTGVLQDLPHIHLRSVILLFRLPDGAVYEGTIWARLLSHHSLYRLRLWGLWVLPISLYWLFHLCYRLCTADKAPGWSSKHQAQTPAALQDDACSNEEHFVELCLLPKLPAPTPDSPTTMFEPQDAAAPRSNPSAGRKPVACQHLAHMGRRGGRQLNQQRGISWLIAGSL
ncbi:hypothetical protein INR49_004996, partial [Caranx melampygus]